MQREYKNQLGAAAERGDNKCKACQQREGSSTEIMEPLLHPLLFEAPPEIAVHHHLCRLSLPYAAGRFICVLSLPLAFQMSTMATGPHWCMVDCQLPSPVKMTADGGEKEAKVE